MKFMKSLTLAFCAATLLASLSIARADDKKACCAATVDAEKKCEHKCCTKAAEEGKICKKCHPDDKTKAEDKK
ncbi:MAG: hypothetical protein JWR26_2343 [Pedosphaera sp.]|nr:hypothetical protein [Pedosphaera sp.]